MHPSSCGRRSFLRSLGVWTFCLLWVFSGVHPSKAQAMDISLMKGVYLYNFIRFAQWPGDPGAAREVSVAVYAPQGFVEYLRKISTRSHSYPKMQVRWCASVECADAAHVLYVHGVEDVKLEMLLTAMQGREVLTVSDQPGFVQSGGMIQLVEDRGRLVFDINLRAIQEAGLYISADILDMARKVVRQ